MKSNENYEELTTTARSFLKILTSSDLFYALLLLVLMLIAVKAIDIIIVPIRKKNKDNILFNFLKGCLQALVVIFFGLRILSLSDTMSRFASQILMSSSLIVVVLGFVFQEGLSNIVHGFILTLFKPFNIGDRVNIYIDGQGITGYVQSINLRNTVIINVMNSSSVIVPNSKMDLCVIENNYFGEEKISSNFLDLSITYECDLQKAIHTIEEVILAHPLVQKARNEKKITDPVSVLVRDLGDNGISLRTAVTTLTVEENFIACSDIRKALVLRFKEDPALDFAYPHVHIV